MDIVVIRDVWEAVTVEVKGVAKKYDWPASNLATDHPNQHFVVLVSFEGLIQAPGLPSPRVWIVPFADVERFKRHYKNRTNVSRSAIVTGGEAFENALHLIAGVDS